MSALRNILGALGLSGADRRTTMAKQYPVSHSDAEWRKLLTREQYQIMRQHGTEMPGSCALLHEKRAGTFHCAACEQRLIARGAMEGAGTFFVQQRATSRHLGAVLAHDLVLLAREQLAPFGVAVADGILLGHCRSPIRPGKTERTKNVPQRAHLIASGLTGEPTAPVIGIAGATNRNS